MSNTQNNSTNRTIHLYLPKDLEIGIKGVIKKDSKFESIPTFIRYCIREKLKEEFYDEYYGAIKNEK